MVSVRFFVCGLLVSLALGSQVQAKLMRVPIDFKATLKSNELSVQATGTSGFPINLGKFEAVIVDTASARVSVSLRETPAGGTYVGRVPAIQPRNVTFVIRDVTYPEQILEVEQAVAWPLTGPLSLSLTPPPREPVSTGPSLPLLLTAGLAALIGLVALRNRVFGSRKQIPG